MNKILCISLTILSFVTAEQDRILRRARSRRGHGSNSEWTPLSLVIILFLCCGLCFGCYCNRSTKIKAKDLTPNELQRRDSVNIKVEGSKRKSRKAKYLQKGGDILPIDGISEQYHTLK